MQCPKIMPIKENMKDGETEYYCGKLILQK